jgi:hypothetical protein
VAIHLATQIIQLEGFNIGLPVFGWSEYWICHSLHEQEYNRAWKGWQSIRKT